MRRADQVCTGRWADVNALWHSDQNKQRGLLLFSHRPLLLIMKKKKTTAKLPVWTKHLWWFVPLIAILVYIPSFNADFTLDDVLIVEENTYIRSIDKIPEIWTSHYWAGKLDATDKGLYRPLTLTTYNLQYALSGASAPAFHIVNILLHALVCFVLMWFVNRIFLDERLSLLSGLLFAIHPIHTEAVSGIVGRAEIMAALFILLAMICYHQWIHSGKIKWLAGLLLATTAAITSKEHGFLIPVLIGLQETFYFFKYKKHTVRDQKKWIAWLTVTVLAIAWWIFRNTITGKAASHEMWFSVSPTDRMATALRTTAEYIGMHLLPLHLSADYWINEVPIVGFGNIAVLLSILVISGLLLATWLVRRQWTAVSWGILFFFLMLLPVSNFLFAAGFLKAERILYIPSIGLIMVMAWLLIRLFELKNFRIPAIGLACLLVLFYTGKTISRAADWQNNYTLSIATLKTSPDSPRFNNMMGLELKARKQGKEAMAYFEKAVQSNPNHVPALVNLGLAYRSAGRHQESADILERALELNPNTLATYVNLMSAYRSLNDNKKNLKVAQKALARYPQSAPIMWNAANAYQLMGDMVKADELRAQARALDPNIGAN